MTDRRIEDYEALGYRIHSQCGPTVYMMKYSSRNMPVSAIKLVLGEEARALNQMQIDKLIKGDTPMAIPKKKTSTTKKKATPKKAAPKKAAPKKAAPKEVAPKKEGLGYKTHRAGSRKGTAHVFYDENKPSRQEFIAYCKSIDIQASTASCWYQAFKI